MAKQYQNTIVVNLIAGPCAGKSTVTSGIFYKLKMAGVDCEMALEYAKDRVWEEAFATMDDQIYVFGKQYHRIWRLNGKVQVIITDSPLPLSIYYAKMDSNYFSDFVIEQFNKFNNMTYVIERTPVYNPKGRLHTEEQSKEIDKTLVNILKEHNINYKTVKTTEAVDIITKDIFDILNL